MEGKPHAANFIEKVNYDKVNIYLSQHAIFLAYINPLYPLENKLSYAVKQPILVWLFIKKTYILSSLFPNS